MNDDIQESLGKNQRVFPAGSLSSGGLLLLMGCFQPRVAPGCPVADPYSCRACKEEDVFFFF